MASDSIDRRTFLKIMGLGSSGLLLSGCDVSSPAPGTEQVTSYVDPEEYVIPGDEVWYASTCLQCPAGCGIHARQREGRVRKLEGNPASPVNLGRLCVMGQAGLQNHYHPDRLKQPLAREGKELREIPWTEARKRLAELAARARASGGGRAALLTGRVSGHLAVLTDAFAGALGRTRRYVYEPLAAATAEAVNRQTLGTATPQLRLDEARLIVSFGADFLGPWRSPVHLATQFARFRDTPRGTLIQVEPKMTLTGGNADWWLAIRPGTEGFLMLGVARLLAESPGFVARVPDAVRPSLRAYDAETVSRVTDVSAADLQRLAAALRAHRPSLVLAGGAAEGQEQGARNVAAALLLNHMLGNLDKTLTGAAPPLPQLAPRAASTRALFDLAAAADGLDTLFVYGANPLYTAPDFLKLEDKLKGAAKVVFATVPDETVMGADLVIPVRSALEDWGTHVPGDGATAPVLGMQQPVMQPLYPELPGTGDIFLELLKQLEPKTYGGWEDFYAYVRHSVQLLRPLAQKPAKRRVPHAPAEREFWEDVLSQGVLSLPARRQALAGKFAPLDLAPPRAEADHPFTLIPSARLGLYDGRHANLPWLQELPDTLTTIVWDSWVEVHPEVAARLGIKEGDLVEVSSPNGSLTAKAVLFPGIHPEAVAVPIGQGHEIGRYAKGVGVNPFKILAPRFDQVTGELALHATRVRLRPTGAHEPVVKDAATESQHARRLVRTQYVQTGKAKKKEA